MIIWYSCIVGLQHLPVYISTQVLVFRIGDCQGSVCFLSGIRRVVKYSYCAVERIPRFQGLNMTSLLPHLIPRTHLRIRDLVPHRMVRSDFSLEPKKVLRGAGARECHAEISGLVRANFDEGWSRHLILSTKASYISQLHGL